VNKTTNSEVSFAMKTIWEEFKQNKHQYKDILKEDDIYPGDKMDIDPFLHVTDPKVTALLQQSPNSATQLAAEYLIQAHDYYTTWMDNKIPITTKITKLESIVQYFTTITTYNTDLLYHIKHSTESLKALHLYLSYFYSWNLTGTSWLSTLVTENYFSKVHTHTVIIWIFTHLQIRAKIRYPNYWEVCFLHRRAQHELVKAYAKDYAFPVRDKRFGKKYANLEGVEFSVANDIEYCTRTLKAQQKQDLLAIHGGTTDDKQKAHQLVAEFPCTRKRLLIREITCKQNPLVINKHISTR